MPLTTCAISKSPITSRVPLLLNDAALTPLGGSLVADVAPAKADLKKAQLLDGMGYYMTYELCEDSIRSNLKTLILERDEFDILSYGPWI